MKLSSMELNSLACDKTRSIVITIYVEEREDLLAVTDVSVSYISL
jgi:hypothetical protein